MKTRTLYEYERAVIKTVLSLFLLAMLSICGISIALAMLEKQMSMPTSMPTKTSPRVLHRVPAPKPVRMDPRVYLI